MSASAQEPIDPDSASGPTEDAPSEGAAREDAPIEQVHLDGDPSASAPKTGQQPRRNPILTSPNVESAPASARAEPPQLSWPPWQQRQSVPAGDTTTAGVHSGAQPADEWDHPADPSKQAQARYATGLIVI